MWEIGRGKSLNQKWSGLEKRRETECQSSCYVFPNSIL